MFRRIEKTFTDLLIKKFLQDPNHPIFIHLGGGGEVYLAEHIPTRQQRVVKLVSKDKTGK